MQTLFLAMKDGKFDDQEASKSPTMVTAQTSSEEAQKKFKLWAQMLEKRNK